MLILTTEDSHSIRPIKLSTTLISSSNITISRLKIWRFTPAFSHLLWSGLSLYHIEILASNNRIIKSIPSNPDTHPLGRDFYYNSNFRYLPFSLYTINYNTYPVPQVLLMSLASVFKSAGFTEN